MPAERMKECYRVCFWAPLLPVLHQHGLSCYVCRRKSGSQEPVTGFCNKPCVMSPLRQGVGALQQGLQSGVCRVCMQEHAPRATHPSSQVFCSGLFPAKCPRDTWASAGGWLLGGLKQRHVGKQVSLENTGVTARQQWAVLEEGSCQLRANRGIISEGTTWKTRWGTAAQTTRERLSLWHQQASPQQGQRVCTAVLILWGRTNPLAVQQSCGEAGGALPSSLLQAVTRDIGRRG